MIDFNKLQIGQMVFIVANTGSAGIFKYQYTGIVKDYFNNRNVHLFLSEYLVNLYTVEVGKEKISRTAKIIHETETQAKEYKQFLIESELSEDY